MGEVVGAYCQQSYYIHGPSVLKFGIVKLWNLLRVCRDCFNFLACSKR